MNHSATVVLQLKVYILPCIDELQCGRDPWYVMLSVSGCDISFAYVVIAPLLFNGVCLQFLPVYVLRSLVSVLPHSPSIRGNTQKPVAVCRFPALVLDVIYH